MAQSDDNVLTKKVAIVGCGLIGSSWATLFASAGFNVCIYDVTCDIVEFAKTRILNNLKVMETNGLLKGAGNADKQFQNITSAKSLSECVEGAFYCQESVCERLEIKKDIFKKMDALVDDSVIIASSTSALPPSSFVADLKNRARCLVAHPVNPPLFIKLVEIVPTEWTSPETIEIVRKTMKSIGQAPVVVKKEVPGFVLNRIQFAIIEESWRLVKDKIVSPEDIDLVMSEGLGPRYAFFGPFEVMHLNANGIRDYMDRYMDGVIKVVDNFGPKPSFTETEVKNTLSKTLSQKLPIEKLDNFLKKRENCLIELNKLKRNIENEFV